MSDTIAILDALREQLGCYRTLARLAEAQHDHVQQNRTEELLDVLSRRQNVLDDLSRQEQTLSPAKKQWATFVSTLNDERRVEAEGMMAEARHLLEAITTSDRNDAMVLQQRKLNLGKQITQASAAKQVNRTIATSAYGTATGTSLNVKR